MASRFGSGVGEILVERHRARVEIDEVEARSLLEARHALQVVEAALVEPLSVAEARVLIEQLARALVRPAVVGADEALAVAARLATDCGTAMTAGVEERVDLAVHVAVEDQLPIDHGADDEVALVADFGLVTQHDPGAAQDAALLLLEHLGAGVRRAVHEEPAALAIEPQVSRAVGLRSLQGSDHGGILGAGASVPFSSLKYEMERRFTSRAVQSATPAQGDPRRRYRMPRPTSPCPLTVGASKP